MHRMDMRSREQYLKALLGRYLRVRKRGKSALLDEYCRNRGMVRKSVLRKIAGLLKGGSPPRKQRRPVYGKAGRGESHRQEDPAQNDRLGPPPSRVPRDGLGPSLRSFDGRGVCPRPLRPAFGRDAPKLFSRDRPTT